MRRRQVFAWILFAHAGVAAALATAATTASRPAVSKTPELVYNQRLHAHNVFTPSISAAVVDEASEIFRRELRPQWLTRYSNGQLQKPSELPCDCMQTRLGRFFVVQPGIWSSDIAWISVDDDATHQHYLRLFEQSGIPEQMAPVVDHERGLRMFSAYYVVRSQATGSNMHVDFVPAVGCNAFTLMTPLADFAAPDFQLLYQDLDGVTRQYRYTRGEAICFGSHFQHTTEPGRAAAADGGLHAYLCFTFGSDKEEHFAHVYETQGSYASRVIRTPSGETLLTDIGRHLEAHGRNAS
jgi:hypothetical protein